LLFACVFAQFIGFALMLWTPQPYEHMKGQWKPVTHVVTWGGLMNWLTASTRPAVASSTAVTLPSDSGDNFFPVSEEGRRLNVRKQWDAAYTMIVPVTQLASLIAVSSQAIIVFVTLLVILVAQAPGVAQMTRSLNWSVLLLFMFLPWQYCARDFPIPGVIYGYSELLQKIGPVVAGDGVTAYDQWKMYGRFIIWPVVGLFVLLITSERYRAGVMIAIGHPLQSMLQPRGGGAGALRSPLAPPPPAGGSGPRPLVLPTSGKSRV
jgi:hypothetical protein